MEQPTLFVAGVAGRIDFAKPPPARPRGDAPAAWVTTGAANLLLRLLAALLSVFSLGAAEASGVAQPAADYVSAPNQYMSVDGQRLAYRSLHPDSGHASLFQRHALFVSQVDALLEGARVPATEQERIVRHITQRTYAPFHAFIAKFEAQLGRNDPSAYVPLLADAATAEKAKAIIRSQEGASGLMIFHTLSIGRLMALDGRPAEAIQYLIGNPLVAHEMVRENIAAALNAPLRVLVYADAEGRAVVEYDLPSSTFGALHSAAIDAVARELDGKLARLIDKAAS